MVDVTQPVKVNIWSERVLGRGVPDILINNAAAVMNDPAPLWQINSPKKFAQLITINIIGVANVIRAFAPAMIERKRGVIVNFSSGWGRSVSPEVAPYCMSKWAIEGLTKALGRGTAPGYGGCCAAESGRYRHRDAPPVLGRRRSRLPQGRRLGCNRRPIHSQARP